MGLSKTDFFTKVSFHGETALRLIYKVDRYSEDLDFTLEKPNAKFIWKPYLENKYLIDLFLKPIQILLLCSRYALFYPIN